MPNRAARYRADVEARHPGAVLRRQSERGFSYQEGRKRHCLVSTGPLHWRKPGEAWQDIDTDLEGRADPTWRYGVRSAAFDTTVTDGGERRFYPRRGVDEWVGFGRLQARIGGQWSDVLLGAPTWQANRLIFDRPDYALELAVTGRGFRIRFLCRTPQVVRPLRWPVSLHGLLWDQGRLVSVSDAAQVGTVQRPRWEDAEGKGGFVPWDYRAGHVILSPDLPADAVFPVIIDPDYSTADRYDDGWADSTGSAFDTGGTELRCGRYNSATHHTWLRFDGLDADQGDECDEADITFISYANRTSDILSDLVGVDEDDHVAPADYAGWAADHAAHTSASVAWDITVNWSAGSSQTTPDLSTILEEIFARGSWANGNAVGIHWDDGGTSGTWVYLAAASYDHASYDPPLLSYTVTAGGVTQPIAATVAAAATVAGTVQPTVRAAAAVQAAATVQGSLAPVTRPVAATVVSAVTVAGDVDTSIRIAAAVAAAATVAGVFAAESSIAATVAASATVAGAFAAATHRIVGAAASAVTVQGALRHQTAVAGTAEASTAAAGAVRHRASISAAVAAASAAAGAVQIATTSHLISGDIAAASAAAGTVVAAATVHAAVAAAATVQGALGGEADLAGTVQAAATVQGGLRHQTAVAATVQAAALVAGQVDTEHGVGVVVAFASTVVGALRTQAAVAAAVVAAATVAGSVAVSRTVAASAATVVSAVTGSLRHQTSIHSVIAAAATAAGSVLRWASGGAGAATLTVQTATAIIRTAAAGTTAGTAGSATHAVAAGSAAHTVAAAQA